LNISFNNRTVSVSRGTTLLEVLQRFEYDPGQSLFAVALNNTFVPNDQYEVTRLNDLDKIDVLRPITGG